MCGIFGVWNWDGAPVALDDLIAARDTMDYRGPDDAGHYISGNVGLAHRRLSFVDLSSAGRMPMSNETGDVWATFNGEIYNYQQLRDQLIAKGHQFRTRTDSETIIHAYEEWGTDCFNMLSGMFAIGIWDGRKRQMVLARDPHGKKPLYYFARPNCGLVYASVLQPLAAWPWFPRDVNERSLYRYITHLYVPSPDSIFRDTYKLPPGHFAVFEEDGRSEVKTYWSIVDVANQEPFPERPEAEYLAEIKSRIQEAVRRRLMGDVPVGAFLSGGIDSSLVVALMKEVCTYPVRTFTIGFNSDQYDESRYAIQVAKHLNVDNTCLMMDGRELLELLPDIIRYYDEPMADYSSLCTMAVSQLAHQHVKAVLSGDGGDEFFGGYQGYLALKIFETYSGIVPHPVRQLVSKLSPLCPFPRIRKLVRRSGAVDAGMFYGKGQNAGRHIDLETIIPREHLVELPEDEVPEFIRSRSNRSPVESAMLYDATHTMIDAFLHKVDRATMAFSLEARCPLLDKEFTEYAVRLPMSLRVHGFQKKYALRKLLAEYLPRHLIDRPKTGFTPPLRDWFRKDLREMLTDMLSPATVAARGYFKPEGVNRLLREHLQEAADHTQLLWNLLMLEMWFRKFEDAPTARPEAVPA
ncbi:MAG TPA: asparagine synthase (glutamine-hydrolyzing) [Pirellulales bacterium]|jgi:asparagine synthase (glutamine-hydrolysing)